MVEESPRRIRRHREARVAARVTAVLLPALMVAGCIRLARDVDAIRADQLALAERLDRISGRLAALTVRQQQLWADVGVLRADAVTRTSGLAASRELEQRVAALERAIERLKRPLPSAVTTYEHGWDSPEAMFSAAVSAQQRGATDVALTLFGQIQQLWPEDDWAIGARVRRAEILQRQGMLLDAMDELLYVIESHPDSSWTADAYLALARGLLVMGRTSEAQRLLQDLVMLFPQSSAAVEGGRLLADLLTSGQPATAPATQRPPTTRPVEGAEVTGITTALPAGTTSAITEPVVVAPPPELSAPTLDSAPAE